MSFDLKMQAKVENIENILKKYLPEEKGLQKTVMEAMNYSLMAGGKRLRPMLMEESFLLFDGDNRQLLEPFMAAIEMIHNYSLVHDDLPAMDNDEYRRGKKTTHIEYGEAMAILAGDGLLNYAFETAIKSFGNIKGDKEDALDTYQKIASAMKILANKAGIHGMIGGQVVDIEDEQAGRLADSHKSRLEFIHHHKTSALIEASMMIGAVLAGAKEDEIKQIEKIANGIGLSFQIRDDILDVTSSEEVLGKPVHSDEKNEKTTYVTIMGIDAASKEVARISREAIKTYDALSYKNEFLKELILKLVDREK